MDTSTNLFKIFSFGYLEDVNRFISLYSDKEFEAPEIFRKMYITSKGKKVSMNDNDISNLKVLYDSLFTHGILDNSRDINDWLLLVKKFTEFIRIAEKCFMYQNDDSNIVYADVDDKNATSILYIKDKNYKVKYRISFQDSAISLPNKSSSSIMNFINDTEPEDSTVLFIQIDIIREFGKEMRNEFKFVHSSAIPYNDDTDKVLMESTRRIISRIIFDTYSDIINNNIAKITGKPGITLEKVLNNDLRIW